MGNYWLEKRRQRNTLLMSNSYTLNIILQLLRDQVITAHESRLYFGVKQEKRT